MTDHKTENTESQFQDKSLSANSPDQDKAYIPKAEYSTQKANSNENTSRPSERRSFFWLSIVFDALLFIVTSVYAFFAYHQWQAMNRQADVMNRQAEVMARQLEQSQKMIEMAQGTSEQTERLIAHSGEQAKASTDQAKAAVIQAEAAKQSVGAAQTSARASEQVARIAQQSFYIGDRPYVTARNAEIDKFEAGAKPTVIIYFINTGKTPAIEVQVGAIVSVGRAPEPDFNVALKQTPSDLVYPFMPEGGKMLLPAGGETYAEAQGLEVLSNATVEEIKSSKMFLFVWGVALYKDGLGKNHFLRFCMFYDPNQEAFIACPTFNSTN